MRTLYVYIIRPIYFLFYLFTYLFSYLLTYILTYVRPGGLTWPSIAISTEFHLSFSFQSCHSLKPSKFIVLVKRVKLVPFARLIHHSSLISGSTIIILCLIAIRIVIGCVDLMLAFLAFIRIVCIGDLIIECIAVVFQPDSAGLGQAARPDS